MGNYWGIQIVSAVTNILGALSIALGLYFFTFKAFGVVGVGIILGGVFLIAQAQLLGLAVSLAKNVAHIAEAVQAKT